MAVATRTENAEFLTISEFKSRMGLDNESAQVIKSPITGKLFLAIGSARFKCQADINPEKEMKMIITDKNNTEACLTNVKSSAENVMFTL